MIKVVNPTTNEVFAQIKPSSDSQIQNSVTAAKQAFSNWRDIGVDERVKLLDQLYTAFENHKKELGELATKSMGMPVSLRDELDIDGGLHYFRWYLDHVAEILNPETTYQDDTSINTVYYEPTGVAAVITPWNFPFCNFVWGVIPNLLVGNTVVFKHASECAAFGQLLDDIIATVKLPKGVFNQVYGDGQVGDTLVHQDIDLICFTGSTAVGQYLYSVASQKFIKAILELGGSAPGIVFPDTDLDKLVEGVFFNRFANSGQICDGLKRLIVHKDILPSVEKALIEMLKEKTVGDPTDPKTDIGPLVSQRQVDTLTTQVNDATDKGAKVLFQSKVPKTGAFYPPTILTNVTTDMKVWRQEVFGPVLPIVTFSTQQQAIDLANDTIYGLGGYIFTENKSTAKKVAAQIKTGMISINSTLYLQPSSPFGGYKQSGLGREHGKYGFHDLCQIKVVSSEK